MKHGPPMHLPHTIKLDPTPKSQIRGNGGGKGGNRQGQLLAKTWESVETLPSTRMGAAQRSRTTTKAMKPRSKLRIVWKLAVMAFLCSPPTMIAQAT
jgi:hypothetical protein